MHTHIRTAVKFILHIFNSNIIRSICTRTHTHIHECTHKKERKRLMQFIHIYSVYRHQFGAQRQVF